MAANPQGKIPREGSAPQPFVSTPLRAQKQAANTPFDTFFLSIASHFPDLKKRLFMAEMPDTPHEFVRKVVTSAAGLTLGLEFALYVLLNGMRLELLWFIFWLAVMLPVFGLLTFNFMMAQPNLRIIRRGKKIDQDMLFAGRHILIELRSGLTLFDAMLGVSQDYGEVSKEFNKIVEKITLGVPANVALHDVADHSPSPYFRRLMLQISNSLMSGSDIANSMEVVLDQIAKEQVIQVKAYGQKLNPIVMFFMLFGVIIPSLGVAFIILLLSFIGSGFAMVGSTLLIGVFLMVGIIQFLFLSMVESSRPSFDVV